MRIELEKVEQIDLLEDGLLEAEAIIIEDGCEGKIEKVIVEGILTYTPLAETPEEDVGFGNAESIECPVVLTALISESSDIAYEDVRAGKVSPDEILELGWESYEIERA